MTIFCDTNIALEFLQERKLVDEVRRIIAHAISNGDDLFISYGSFYTITYLTEIYLKEDKTLDKSARIARLRYILNGVLGTFKLAENDKHFRRYAAQTSMKIMTPTAFIESYM